MYVAKSAKAAKQANSASSVPKPRLYSERTKGEVGGPDEDTGVAVAEGSLVDAEPGDIKKETDAKMIATRIIAKRAAANFLCDLSNEKNSPLDCRSDINPCSLTPFLQSTDNYSEVYRHYVPFRYMLSFDIPKQLWISCITIMCLKVLE